MARSSITVNQILADARMLSGANDYSKVTNESMIAKYNLVLPKIYSLLNGARFRKFMAHAPAGTHSTSTVGINAGLSSGVTYTASTKKITLPVGETISSSAVGGLCLFYYYAGPPDGAEYCYFSDVTAVTTNTDFTVRSGPTFDMGTGTLAYVLIFPPSRTNNTIPISSHRIDKIVGVYFPTRGEGVNVDDDVIESVSGNPNYTNEIAYAQSGTSSGDVLKIIAGSGTTNSGGFPVIFFEEKPYRATTVSDYVDLPTEYHAILCEEIARLTLLELGSKIPKALENPLMTLETVSQTFQATLDAFAQSKDAPK